MADTTCPVGYTCSSIDAVISDIGHSRDSSNSAASALNDIISSLDMEGDLCEKLQGVLDEINDSANYLDCLDSSMEEIRSDNQKLREWGEEMAAEVTTLEEELNNQE